MLLTDWKAGLRFTNSGLHAIAATLVLAALVGCSTSSKLNTIEAMRSVGVSFKYNAAKKETEYAGIIANIEKFSDVQTCMVSAVEDGAVDDQPEASAFRAGVAELGEFVSELEAMKLELDARLIDIKAQKDTGDHDIKSDPLYGQITADIRSLDEFKKVKKPRLDASIGKLNALYKQMAKREVSNGVPADKRKVIKVTDCFVAAS